MRNSGRERSLCRGVISGLPILTQVSHRLSQANRQSGDCFQPMLTIVWQLSVVLTANLR